VASQDDRIERIRARILPAPARAADPARLTPDFTPPVPFEQPPVEAAVLIGLVRRNEGYAVLYPERASELRSHSGQISFPGGKVDRTDFGAGSAALREANEEIGLDIGDAELIGYLPSYLSRLNYLITPVVALIEPRHPFMANPLEVREIFEVPLAFLAADQNYGTYTLRRGTMEHSTWRLDYDGWVIWGITANLTRQFKETALFGDEVW
jgi:8-oxo-dGTP pyrophosphatase MutT (NUDIX family)